MPEAARGTDFEAGKFGVTTALGLFVEGYGAIILPTVGGPGTLVFYHGEVLTLAAAHSGLARGRI